MFNLFNEIQHHIYNDDKPSIYLNSIYETDIFKKDPFFMLYRLKDIPQSPKHHAEGNVWNHTMLVLDEAAKVRWKSRDPHVFMWSCLLHDIGKATTTKIKRDKITAYGHDEAGAVLAIEFLSYFMQDKDFIERVYYLIRYHMHLLYVLKQLPYADYVGLKKNTDIYEVALLGLCDRLGRFGVDSEKEYKNVNEFIKIISNV